MMKIDQITFKPQVDEKDRAQKDARIEDSFSEILKKSLDEVNELQNKADSSIKSIAEGKIDNIQDAVIAIEKADLSLKLVTEIRNKAIEAYKEIMRMQV